MAMFRARTRPRPLPRLEPELGSGIADVRAWTRAGSAAASAPTRRVQQPLDTFFRDGARAGLARFKHARAAHGRRHRRARHVRRPAALGFGAEIGSLEPGARGGRDRDRRRPRAPGPAAAADVYSTIVHASGPADVPLTMVQGRCSTSGGHTTLDHRALRGDGGARGGSARPTGRPGRGAHMTRSAPGTAEAQAEADPMIVGPCTRDHGRPRAKVYEERGVAQFVGSHSRARSRHRTISRTRIRTRRCGRRDAS